MEWWLQALLFPILYTAIGALIGGLYAYKIAKDNFSIDRINEGTAYISLLKMTVDSIYTQSNELIEYLSERTTTYSGRGADFLAILFEKTTKMESELSSFSSCWNRYSDKIWICSMKHVCKNPSKRKKYEKVTQNISSTCSVIMRYQQLTKKYEGKCIEKTKSETNGITADEFLSSTESVDMLQQAGALLKELSEKCDQIRTHYSMLE